MTTLPLNLQSNLGEQQLTLLTDTLRSASLGPVASVSSEV